uniref:Uncharacterized protein n=1 Tax=Rhizophagus irregularis (strain DAOM 181602 / DAOM 197198 / MUCL 43194) TaxID=747089 RepID=U9T308_RHIID
MEEGRSSDYLDEPGLGMPLDSRTCNVFSKNELIIYFIVAIIKYFHKSPYIGDMFLAMKLSESNKNMHFITFNKIYSQYSFTSYWDEVIGTVKHYNHMIIKYLAIHVNLKLEASDN